MLPRRFFVILLFLLTHAAPVVPAESLPETINYLIDYVAKSKATFIRNGTEHSAAEAAAHIRAKYEHFKSEIKTPEDFIRLAASRSLLSGKPYLVRVPGGKEQRLDEWLTGILRNYRAKSPYHPILNE